jgi:hypothetical protein
MHATCGFIARIIFHPTKTNAPKKIHSEQTLANYSKENQGTKANNQTYFSGAVENSSSSSVGRKAPYY